MSERLNTAARCGHIETLYSSIQEDAYVLEHIDSVPYIDTPLHISASAGHTHFSMEIMRLKPSFARKLNPDGFSPIHLALQNEQMETVFRLLDVDSDLARVHGMRGITPLHIAAADRNPELLAKILATCPESIKELTIKKETALHIAVWNDNIEGLKVLLGFFQQVGKTCVLNWADDEGNTILHIAAFRNQIEMVKLLVNRVDNTAKNLDGLTILDIFRQQGLLNDKDVLNLLQLSGVLKGSSVPSLGFLFKSAGLKLSSLKRLVASNYREVLHVSNEDRNAVLVVSVLIATTTYQAVLNPPSAQNFFHQYESLPEYAKLTSAYMRSTVYFIFIDLFTTVNTIAFLASMTEIYAHLPSGIGYALLLVLPLVICFLLLMLLASHLAAILYLAFVFTVLLLSKSSIVYYTK